MVGIICIMAALIFDKGKPKATSSGSRSRDVAADEAAVPVNACQMSFVSEGKD